MIRQAFILALAVPLLSGCYQSIRIDDPDESPPPWDAGPPTTDDASRPPDGAPRPRDAGPFEPPGTCVEATGVDLLLVVDNSNSMHEEQESLAAALPTLVTALVSPPDEDGDGEPDWLPVTDLQIGVITTDMGSGGHVIPTCNDPNFGDDGVLRTVGQAVSGCAVTYPPFFSYSAGSRPAEELAFDVGCVARAGVGGCGFEQPLEAMLKALSPAAPTSFTGPSYRPPTFFRSTRGHGDGVNAGFVRDGSLLAVLIVTDEDDCSALEPDLFDPNSLRFTNELNLRCFGYPEALHPVSRYIAGFEALRPDRPDLLALGLLVGVPVDLADPRDDFDFELMLRDPRLEQKIDPAVPHRVLPSCGDPVQGEAEPPVRLLTMARGLGAYRVSVQSICQEDYRPVTASFARLFGRRACMSYED